jgi:ankyrin repeat protein
MNIKKTIIFTGLSLLLSSTFNSAYSTDGADGDETNQPKDRSRKRPFYSATESDGYGAGGGASSSASSAGKTPGDWAGQPLEGLAATPSNAPRGWEQHVRTGVAYFNQGKFSEAIFQFTAALAIEGIDGKTRVGCLGSLGNAYFKEGKILEAIDQYTAALAIGECDGKARASCLENLGRSHFNLGNAYAGQKNYGDAITEFRLASKLVPDRVRSELKGPLGIELLMHAVDIESQENARFLLANGVDIDARELYALQTALMRAKSVEMAGFLLDVGADINAENNFGETPLEIFMERYIASYPGRSSDMVALLLARGADVNAGRGAQLNLLRGLDVEGAEELFNLLLNNGVEINARDNDGRTALMKLDKDCSDNYKIPILLRRGAEVNAVDNEGMTALMVAVEGLEDNEDYLEQLRARVTLLINGGADIGIRDNNGRNVLDIFESEDLKQFIRDQYNWHAISNG